MSKTIATSFNVVTEGNTTFIKLYDVKGNFVEGKDAIWKGNFYCGFNNLTTIQGAPSAVKGDFYCNNNNLTSLQGAPSIVEGYFRCNNNKLTTLQGAPSIVEGSFYCCKNKLTALQGAPSVVEGNFYCGNNYLSHCVIPKHLKSKFYPGIQMLNPKVANCELYKVLWG